MPLSCIHPIWDCPRVQARRALGDEIGWAIRSQALQEDPALHPLRKGRLPKARCPHFGSRRRCGTTRPRTMGRGEILGNAIYRPSGASRGNVVEYGIRSQGLKFTSNRLSAARREKPTLCRPQTGLLLRVRVANTKLCRRRWSNSRSTRTGWLTS
jgi:hypothetical protein